MNELLRFHVMKDGARVGTVSLRSNGSVFGKEPGQNFRRAGRINLKRQPVEQFWKDVQRDYLQDGILLEKV